MKKFFSLILGCVLIFTLVGCGSKEESQQKNNPQTLTQCVKNIEGINVINVTDCTDEKDSFALIEINDNIANDRLSLADDCCKLLESLGKSKKYNNINKINVIITSNDFIDKCGKKTKQKLLSCMFEKNKINKINWSEFNIEKIFDLASNIWIYEKIK